MAGTLLPAFGRTDHGLERNGKPGDEMTGFHVQVGDRATFSKTVSESDVYLFAGITGDLAPNHVNKAYMQATAYGERIAHGALLIGYMSTTSTMITDASRGSSETAVSLGYDRIRFLKPVFLGDTITVTYTFTAIDLEAKRSTADIEITNQDDELTTVGQHILKWVPNS